MSNLNQTSELIDKIQLGLNALCQEEIYGKKDWTTAIKKKLEELADTMNLKSCGYSDNEWLYDFVWYKVDANEYLQEVVLVAESEWALNLNEVKYDFEKLLLANAGLRLMVCEAKIDKTEEYKQYFKEAIAVYKQGKIGDTFLIAIFNEPEWKFDYCVFTKE